MKTTRAFPNAKLFFKMRLYQYGVLLLTFALGSINALADSFTDDFSTGINKTNWFVSTNSSRFSVEATNGVVQIQSTAGTSTGYFWGSLWSTLTAYGNFDVSIDFTNANLAWLTGGPGNQAQLNCFFGNFTTLTNFFVVRSDESAWSQNAHIWVGDFGGFKLGSALSTNVSSGTLRVTRTNSLVSGYLNSTLIAQTNYVTTPVKFQIILQNNGTKDAISINYDNFSLSADQITVGPGVAIQYVPQNKISLSWPTWGVAWTTNYVLESANSLSSPNWQPVTNAHATSGTQVTVTNAITNAAQFYRLNR